MTDEESLAHPGPPESLLPAVNGQISAALAALSPGAKGAIVAVATESGVNGAIVAKMPHGWSTVAWIGKQWTGGVVYGAAIRKEW